MKENVIPINGGITINFDVSVKTFVYVTPCMWTPATCSCENGKYLASIMDDSAIRCDENIKEETVKQILMKIKQSVKQKIFTFYLLFY